MRRQCDLPVRKGSASRYEWRPRILVVMARLSNLDTGSDPRNSDIGCGPTGRWTPQQPDAGPDNIGRKQGPGRASLCICSGAAEFPGDRTFQNLTCGWHFSLK